MKNSSIKSLAIKAAFLLFAMLSTVAFSQSMLLDSYASEVTRLRVGLLPPGELKSDIQVRFESGFNLKHSAYHPPAFTYEGPIVLTIKNGAGLCELSAETRAFFSDFDLSDYPDALPLMSQGGIRLMKKSSAFSASEKQWSKSVITEVNGAAASDEQGLRFVLENSKSVIEVNGKKPFKFFTSSYRGMLSVYAAESGGVFPINDIDLESYLYGVVPKEMPASWGAEALKAQAICARTYALGSLGKYSDMDYDLAPTTASQVYGGFDAEQSSTNQAVDATKGEQLYYGADRVQCFYHANNGGYCSASEDVFVTPLPYFKSKPDPYSLRETTPWQVKISSEKLKDMLAKSGVDIGEIRRIELSSINPSKRVEKIKVVGTNGEHEIKGSTFRFAFGLRSAYFELGSAQSAEVPAPRVFYIGSKGMGELNLDKASCIGAGGSSSLLQGKKAISSSGTVEFKSNKTLKTSADTASGISVIGYGYGHGLGLSQWGAKAMAEDGLSYADILSFYYEGAVLRK